MNPETATYEELEEFIQFHMAFGAFFGDCSERAACVTTLDEVVAVQELMHERAKPVLDELGRRREKGQTLVGR